MPGKFSTQKCSKCRTGFRSNIPLSNSTNFLFMYCTSTLNQPCHCYMLVGLQFRFIIGCFFNASLRCFFMFSLVLFLFSGREDLLLLRSVFCYSDFVSNLIEFIVMPTRRVRRLETITRFTPSIDSYDP